MFIQLFYVNEIISLNLIEVVHRKHEYFTNINSVTTEISNVSNLLTLIVGSGNFLLVSSKKIKTTSTSMQETGFKIGPDEKGR